MDRDQVLAGDKKVRLAQRLRIPGVAPSAIENHEDVIDVVVQLGALSKVLGVLECQRMEPE
jgi:hypothetical protein